MKTKILKPFALMVLTGALLYGGAVAANGGEQAVNLLLEFFSVDGAITGCFSD